MPRIPVLSIESASSAAQPLLAAVKQQLGVVPNLMKVLAQQPSALEGYLALNAAAGKGALDVATRERIALTVAEFNRCDYCLSAHAYLGKHVAKLSDSELALAREGHSIDPKADAATRFALKVAATRGHVSDADLQAFKSAGFSDAEVLDVVLNVALNVLTNYVNSVAATPIDFPAVSSRKAA